MSETSGACASAIAAKANDCPLYDKHTKDYSTDDLIKTYTVSCIEM